MIPLSAQVVSLNKGNKSFMISISSKPTNVDTEMNMNRNKHINLYIVTLNSKSVTEIINKLPDNLNGPVLPYRMISF